MSKPPDNIIKLDSKTLRLCEFKAGGDKGFWLYDTTRGQNLAMRATSEAAAFTKALHYYQERLSRAEKENRELWEKVNAFISNFVDTEED